MKFYPSCLFLIFNLLCYGQNPKIDSLSNLLNNSKQLDEERFKIISELSYEYHTIDAHTGLEYAKEAIGLAKQLKRNDLLAYGHKFKAFNHQTLKEDSLAILDFNEAIAIQTKLNNWDQVGRISYNKGLSYFNKSDYEEALNCQELAYASFEKTQDSILMAIVLNSIGTNEMYLTRYPEAIETFMRASTIYEMTGNSKSPRHAEVFSNIGLLYSRIENYETALDYYKKSLEITTTINDAYAKGNTLSNIGNVYDNMDQPNLAIDYYNQSLAIMQSLKNDYGIASALTNTGIAHISLKNYDTALNYLSRSIALWEDLNNLNNLAIVYENIGSIYLGQFNHGNASKTNLLLAKRNLDQSLVYAENINNLERLSSVLHQLADVNYKLNNYRKAYLDKEKAIKLKDSFISVEKKEEFIRLETKYEFEKKAYQLKTEFEKNQALKQAEIEKQKVITNSSIIGGSSILLLGVIGFILFKRKQEEKAKTKEAKFNLTVSNTELKALRSQMNPHFIFNSLNSINAYIANNDIDNATNYLTKFAKLMRETLEKSREKEILLSEDIQILKTYMDIEKKRFNGRFSYKFILNDSLDPETVEVPPMILQPFVENSIIHGLSNISGDGLITISFRQENKMLVCSVKDNGVGRDKTNKFNPNRNKKSLGMEITKSRIDIINKIKNTNGSIEVVDLSKGTEVIIKLPLMSAF
ncbi:tetratricopeptide repeat protein [Winogradskyella alexanderae]|uniref:Tetratricopeptide repeat protein n=1 Tax=Winogradskyella alexanderae TaxID=2877123 RepID=A0ABS7XR95_9FLAO|nr:tetratricopeptide repeat protein [Winogradskyella alexanderae]MCA0131934.1 tetratricopeptide repeat protein [Winogradskyella alexanderae]